MGISLFIESMITALSVGTGCGTCCGSGVSAALYGYITTHVKDIKQSLLSFRDFFLGKLLAVVALCTAASLLGCSMIDSDGLLFGVNVHAIVDILMILTGLYLLIKLLFEKYGKHDKCLHCSAGSTELNSQKPSHLALFGMGFGYGISPCAPLIFMVGYASTLPVSCAALLGCVFAAASTLSPALLLLVLSGVLAGKMRKEIPSHLTRFRIVIYVLLIVFFSISLYKEVFIP